MIYTSALSKTHYLRWMTSDPATGAAADASAQTVKVYENDNDVAIETLVATNVATGHYRTTLTTLVASGYEVEKTYNVVVEATIGGVDCKAVILTFRCSEYDIAGAGQWIEDTNTEMWQIFDYNTIRYGTAVSGSASTIELEASASAIDDFYKDQMVKIVGGTGIGQARRIAGYDGGTKVITVDENWKTNPAVGSDYHIIPTVTSMNISDTGAALVIDEIVEGTYSVREMLRLMGAALLGKVSGGGTVTVTFRDTSDGTNRIVATVDANGNRSAVVLDET